MNFKVTHAVACLRDMVAANTACLTPVEKSQYVATVVGSALGAVFYMPSAPVDIPRNFFLNTHSESASQILGTLNEVYPINIDLALTVASNVYLARYRLVYEPAFIVHALTHLAQCSDDVVPGSISTILNKVGEGKNPMSMIHATTALTIALTPEA